MTMEKIGNTPMINVKIGTTEYEFAEGLGIITSAEKASLMHARHLGIQERVLQATVTCGERSYGPFVIKVTMNAKATNPRLGSD